ncbi:MAG TPA: dihydrofolate reductase family protein [Polyangiaceae bacterium]|nr:dihydrofolate reductase family protein [Polyangiaceae bacterium]
MGKLIVTEFISVDGVVEGPGGGESFKHVGWTFAYKRGEEGDRFKLDETLEAEALLLGRVTFQGFAAAWPTRKDAFADKLNAMPKYVVSTTLNDVTWNNSTILRDVADVRRVKAAVKGNLVVHGSPSLVQALLEADLVDELRLMVFPVALGTGKRLFGETSDKRTLTLRDSKVFGEGVALLVYGRSAPER